MVNTIVIGVRCPHCRMWEAETAISTPTRPIYVSACQRTRTQWRMREGLRRLRTLRARVRVWVATPYWAARRFRLRRSRPCPP
jgi:hypothetical protein